MTDSIRYWAEEDRPREKLILKGSHTLTNSELIAILIGTGTRRKSAVDLSRELLNICENELTKLKGLNVKEITGIPGIGEAKAAKLIATFELMKRVQFQSVSDKKVIRSSADAFQLTRLDFYELGHEEFHVAFFDRANQLLAVEMISKGGLSGTIADGKIIFKKALEHKASGLILYHNHPSGQLRPSEADRRLTRQLTEFAKLIDLQILDHLIVSEDNYFSFADEGML